MRKLARKLSELKYFLPVGILMSLTAPASAQEMKEADYARAYCSSGTEEYPVSYGASAVFVDCLTETHAIEIDWSDKWPEAIGQSLNYGLLTGKVPGVILICRKSEDLCETYTVRMKATVSNYRLPIDVWYCQAKQTDLSKCTFNQSG